MSEGEESQLPASAWIGTKTGLGRVGEMQVVEKEEGGGDTRFVDECHQRKLSTACGYPVYEV